MNKYSIKISMEFKNLYIAKTVYIIAFSFCDQIGVIQRGEASNPEKKKSLEQALSWVNETLEKQDSVALGHVTIADHSTMVTTSLVEDYGALSSTL